MNDSYMKECEATVTEITEKGIILNKTIFYPQGGGQPSDIGKIIFNNKEYDISKVKKENGKIVHYCEHDLSPNDNIRLVIDWDRRYKLMRMHTAAHVISTLFFKKTGALITGNQLDIDKSRIDFNIENFDKEKMMTIVEEANQAMKQGHEVTVSYMLREEALKDPELVKLASVLPPAVKELRIVKIGNLDRQADGGTHVKNTTEVGDIKVISMDNKGKANRRLYYTL